MKVILLTDVSKIGRRYDVKDVSSGHALNFLIPKNLALAATPEAMKKIEKLKQATEGERKVQEELMVQNLKTLDGTSITVKGKANDKGHLFAGLHREEIAAELNKQMRIAIDPSALNIENPIKEIGEHIIPVKFGNHSVNFKLVIEKK